MNIISSTYGLLSVFLCALLASCTEPTVQETKPADITTSTTAFQPSQTTSDQQQDEVVWGGLTIQQSGCELEKADRVLVLLHGYGDHAKSFSRLAKVLEAGESTCLVFPDAPNELGRGRAWFTGAKSYEPTREKVVAMLKHIQEQNPAAKIALGGFSQGAIMSSNFLEKDAELVSELILLAPSGRLREAITGESDSKPKVFLAHGRDDQVLPFSGSEELHQKLIENNYQVEWRPFDGAHTVPREVIAQVNQFLEATGNADSTN